MKFNPGLQLQALNTLPLPGKTSPGPSTAEEKPQDPRAGQRSTRLITGVQPSASTGDTGQKNTRLQLAEATTPCKGLGAHRSLSLSQCICKAQPASASFSPIGPEPTELAVHTILPCDQLQPGRKPCRVSHQEKALLPERHPPRVSSALHLLGTAPGN